MRTKDLERLTEVARLVADRDLARLRILRLRSSALRREAEALGRQEISSPTIELDPATRAGVGVLWDRWRDAELRRLQGQRARNAVEEAKAMSAARKSYGRQIALAEIKDKLR